MQAITDTMTVIIRAGMKIITMITVNTMVGSHRRITKNIVTALLRRFFVHPLRGIIIEAITNLGIMGRIGATTMIIGLIESAENFGTMADMFVVVAFRMTLFIMFLNIKTIISSGFKSQD
jgi:hypothetical protein